jgi:hypothetical protein
MSHRGQDLLTGDLFAVPQPEAPYPAAFDFRAQVAHLVAAVLKDTASDRFALASRASHLAGVEVSKYMLDAYSSEARETFNLPFWLVPAIESACDSYELTNWLVGVRGGRLLVGREVLNAKLGQLERMRDAAGRQIRELKRRMGETG